MNRKHSSNLINRIVNVLIAQQSNTKPSTKSNHLYYGQIRLSS
ncbi:hypothetical protein [Methanobrevibacter sp. TMH8]|nr:hypothetical protein [Methanobrevibacter sp. TMH8]